MPVLRSLSRRVGIGLILASLAIGPASAAQRPPDRRGPSAPAIYVGAHKIRAAAFVDRRRIFVPVRGVFEAVGATVEFSQPHFIVVHQNGAVIAAFILDHRHAIVGRRTVELDSPPTRRDGRVYVPLRVVAEAAGATVAYTNRPAAVHITPSAVETASEPSAASSIAVPAEAGDTASSASWRAGVAVFTALCCLGCLVLTARRFAPTLFRPRPGVIATPPREPPALAPPPSDQVALTSVETTGEARFRKELITETRTIEVPVAREELVIEYAGEGGVVIIEGRQLFAGETVRIPLWEERVQVDVTKHVLLTEDIVAGRRRTPVAGPPDAGAAPPDFTIAEGSPS